MEELIKGQKTRKRATKRPILNYFNLGLEKGDILIFKDNKRTTVTIVDGSHVDYKGKIASLTQVTKKLKDTDNSLQPSPFWIDKKSGELLLRIYNEKYPR